MNVIDKLANFEDMKQLGFIIYNKDGSGKYWKTGSYMKYEILFNKKGKIIEYEQYIFDHVSCVPDYDQDTIIEFLTRCPEANRKYINGWVIDAVKVLETKTLYNCNSWI